MGPAIPALLTKMSIPPSALAVSEVAWATAWASVSSTATECTGSCDSSCVTRFLQQRGVLIPQAHLCSRRQKSGNDAEPNPLRATGYHRSTPGKINLVHVSQFLFIISPGTLRYMSTYASKSSPRFDQSWLELVTCRNGRNPSRSKATPWPGRSGAIALPSFNCNRCSRNRSRPNPCTSR